MSRELLFEGWPCLIRDFTIWFLFVIVIITDYINW